jgi:hypothetical protein
MVVILSTSHKRLNHASICSISFIASLLAIILVLVLSFLIVEYSGGLFVTNIIENQKPYILYNDQFIISATKSNGDTKYYSSMYKFNDYYPSLLSVPLIRVSMLSLYNNYLFRL